MHRNPILGKPGEEKLMLGNHAIARGAIEAGVDVVTGYPGTPSSEILDALADVAREFDLYVEYSVNEKVAFEIALSSSICGLNSMCIMKHVGLNVASDPLLTGSGLNIRGSFVLTVADDPGAWSSQNEQDSRIYGKFAKIPVIEPSSPEEAKDLAIECFRLSRKYKHIVMLRSTTRVSHSMGIVRLGELSRRDYIKNVSIPRNEDLVCTPTNAIKFHKRMLEKISCFEKEFESFKFNYIINEDVRGKGIIAVGAVYPRVLEALKHLGLEGKARVLKLNTPYPVPKSVLERFSEGLSEILVIEELEPIVEEQVKLWAFDNNVTLKVYGKLGSKELVPRIGEVSVDDVVKALSYFMRCKTVVTINSFNSLNSQLPSRRPTLCPGCPHRATMYSLKRAAGENTFYAGDIGCYTLAYNPPLNAIDSCLAMGSSIGFAHGVYISLKKSGVKIKPIAIIGDSTFYHSGISALANAIHKNTDLLVVIVDNCTTAMTGFQPTLETPHSMIEEAKVIDIKRVVEGLGVEFVEVIDPYNVEEAIEVFRKAMKHKGVSVVISKRPCVIYMKRTYGLNTSSCLIDPEYCRNCFTCIRSLGCPAISIVDGKTVINQEACIGCRVCTYACPFNAIRCSGE